jgi:hypothetical protein
MDIGSSLSVSLYVVQKFYKIHILFNDEKKETQYQILFYWAISNINFKVQNFLQIIDLKYYIYKKKIQPHEVLTIKPFPPFRHWTRISSSRNVQRSTSSFLVGVLSL